MMDRVSSAGMPIAMFALTLACGQAAAVPDVLDMVPEDAAVVVAFNNVGDTLADIESVNRLAGDRADPGIGMMAAMVRGTQGVNTEGSAAFIMAAPQVDPDTGAMREPDPDDAILLIPVTNFGAFVEGGETEGGVTSFMMGEMPSFARPMGDFAIVGSSPESVLAFEDGKGRMKTHRSRLGTSGMAIANDADVTIIADIEPFRAQAIEGVRQMQQQAAFFAAMSGGGADAAAPINAMSDMLQAHIRDARTGIVGVSFDQKGGFAIDFGAQFLDGTESAGMFDHAGDAATLLNRLPREDFFLAYAADLRGEGISALAAQVEAAQGAGGDSIPRGMPGMAELTTLGTGTAGIMGANPAFMATGLLSNTTYYVRTDDAAGYAARVHTMVKDADGQEAQGMSFATTVESDAQEIAGTTVDAYSMRITPQAGGAQAGMMNPSQMIQMMFGPNLGPAGYLAELDGGFVQTMGKSKSLAGKAIEAARDGEGLGTVTRVQSVSERLPAQRVAEVYLGVDQILNSTGPLLMLAGAIEQFEPLDRLEPVAFGVSTMGGGVHGRLIVPSRVVEEIIKLVPEQEEIMWDEPAEDDSSDEMEF